MGLAFKDDLFDAQFTRALAYTRYGGAEIGECFETAGRIGTVDVDLWYREWLATAERAEKAGAYLRATELTETMRELVATSARRSSTSRATGPTRS